jgi:hypothetical protein
MSAKSVERARRFRELAKQAAKQFGCKSSSERAKHVATLRLARETWADRLVAGRDTNPRDLLDLDQALKQYLPQATSAPPPSAAPLLHLQICSKKVHSVCERCGHIQPTDVDAPGPLKPDHFKPPRPLMLPAPTNGSGDSDN